MRFASTLESIVSILHTSWDILTCSLNGGIGNSKDFTKSEFKLSTVDPLAKADRVLYIKSALKA